MTAMPPTIFPSLRYKDAARAIEFLEEAFGFRRQMVVDAENGAIAHAELAYGEGMVMLGTDRDDSYGSHVGQGWMYVAVQDVDAHYARAKAAGAEIVRELEEQDYGSRDYSARDFEGNLWSFGTYQPEVQAEP
jgi:uncharacterized glyoxalase superfamily protein PhnB